jgi:hypothetical protein
MIGVEFNAEMYYMWNSGLLNAIPVPLGSVKWKWSAQATLSNGSWTTPSIIGVGVQNLSSIPEYPEWTKVSGQTVCP